MPDNSIAEMLPVIELSTLDKRQLVDLLKQRIDVLAAFPKLEVTHPKYFTIVMAEITAVEMEIRNRDK